MPVNTSFYKILFAALPVIVLFSCKKQATEPVTILTTHTWYPYQTHIIATDSTTITQTNTTTGIKTVRRYNSRYDTTYLNSTCQQQSTFTFQAGGIYLVNNQCYAAQPLYTAAWLVLPANRIRTYVPLSNNPFPTNHPSFAFGDIETIDNSKFIFHNYVHLSIDAGNINIGYDSLVVKDTMTYTTCKSR